jgi:paraquat-inducible protein B
METRDGEKSTPELPPVEVREGPRISAIWLLPLIAATIGGWLLYKGVVEAPVEAAIHFDSAAGIEAGKGATQRAFVAMDAPAPAAKTPKQLQILLTADRRGSVKSGSPVYYRQVKVGEVNGAALAKTADTVNITCAIEKKYAPLVRENSRFWNVSDIGVDLGLFRGGQIKTESLESILAGGLAFATPDEDQMGATAKNGALFSLYDAPEDAWLAWRPKIPL